MVQLTDLPDKMLWLVFSFVGRNDQQAIAALRATNRKCHQLADPLTCIAIAQPLTPPGPRKRSKENVLRHWARKVARDPKCARFVGAVGPVQLGYLGESIESLSEPQRVLGGFKAALEHTAVPAELQSSILEKLKEGKPDAHLAFLLVTCPQITRLHLPGLQWLEPCLRKLLLQELTSSKDIGPSLAPSKISELSVESENDPADILALLRLPDLQVLEVEELGDTNRRNFSDRIPPPDGFTNPNRIALKLDKCMLSGNGLWRLLGACRPRSLTIKWRPGIWNDHLTNESIGIALQQSGQSVRHLLLDTTDVFRSRNQSSVPAFGSFAALAQLQTLAVPAFAFPLEDPASILPAALESLYVLGLGAEIRCVERKRSSWDGRDQGPKALGEVERHWEQDLAPRAGEEKEDALFDALKAASLKMPRLRKLAALPWKYVTYGEWYGPTTSRCVDYDGAELGPRPYLTSSL